MDRGGSCDGNYDGEEGGHVEADLVADFAGMDPVP